MTGDPDQGNRPLPSGREVGRLGGSGHSSRPPVLCADAQGARHASQPIHSHDDAARLFPLSLLCPGCAAERPESVPEDARRLAKHSGTSSFVFTAPSDGEVFIYDRTQNKLVYSGRVRRGESLEVNAKDDRITLNARVVSEEDLRGLDEYEIWFDEGPGTGQ